MTVRIFIVVERAGDETPGALRKPVRFARMPSRDDRSSVFDGYAEHAGRTAGVHDEFVAECGGDEVAGGNALMRLWCLSDETVPIVFCVVDERTCFLIDPVVGNEAVARRIGPGDQRSMADRRLGVGVPVMGVVEYAKVRETFGAPLASRQGTNGNRRSGHRALPGGRGTEAG